jgi:PAS domain S-box-containing protein
MMVIIPLVLASMFYMIFSWVFLPQGLLAAGMSLSVALLLSGVALMAHRGYRLLPGTAIAVILGANGALDQIIHGGISASAQSLYLLSILTAGFTIGHRAALVTSVLAIITTTTITWLKMGGQLPEQLHDRDPLTYWTAQVATFVAVGGLVWNALQRIRAALESARESADLHQLVADTSDEFIWRLDSDGRFQYASPAVRRILGYAPEEVLGRVASEGQWEGGAPNATAVILEALSDGRDSIRFEARQRRRDGSSVWCETTARMLFGEQGNLIGLTGATRDVSKRKRAEEERLEAEEQLRQAQRMEAVGKLAGGIAHDFNNYLTVIMGNAELLALDYEADEGSPIREIEDAAQRSSELTRRLLAFSRRQVLQPVTLDLNEVIVGGDRLLRRILGEDVELEVKYCPDLGAVSVDPAQFEQVVLNLAVNAREAMPEGGRLIIETANRSVAPPDETSGPPVEYVELSVSDTGVGMSGETIERVFEPFFTTRPGTGSGLGLSMVHGIVEQSGGNVGVDSREGVGSTFRVHLPRVERSETDPLEIAEPSDSVSDEICFVGRTVFVVEDQEMIRRLVCQVVEERGGRVVAACDASEALEIGRANEESFDLLLTDIVLPGMNGVRLAEELTKSLPLRVLYMSGYSERAVVDRGFLDPKCHFIQKPFSTRRLVERMQEVMDEPLEGSLASRP